jgi:uncharacterized protein YcfL
MKKVMVIVASMFLASCGGSSESPVSADSVLVSTDSVAVADSSVEVNQGSGAPVQEGGQSPHGVPVK